MPLTGHFSTTINNLSITAIEAGWPADAIIQPEVAMTGDVYVRNDDSPRQVTWNVLLGQA